MSKCEHVNFVVTHDVNRLSRTDGGPVEMFMLSGNVLCYDCGLEFRPFRIKLEPTGRIGVRRPMVMPSAGARAGGDGSVN